MSVYSLVLLVLFQQARLLTGSNSVINDLMGNPNPVNYEIAFDTHGNELRPLLPTSSSWEDPAAELFVGVVHYRDKRCSLTLRNLFSKAKHPERITVGLIQQIHTEDDHFDCVRDYCSKNKVSGADKERGLGGLGTLNNPQDCLYGRQIQKLELTHHESRGPSFARFMQQSLLQNEEFCMQVDAHTDFVQDWDVELMNMWGATRNEYAVLSTSLPDLEILASEGLNTEGGPEVPHLCQATVDERGMVVNLPPVGARNLEAPILSPLWSAGFSFSKCHAEKKVPNDPNLRLIYDADEFVKYARLWTRGYDVYTPNKIVAAHDNNGHMYSQVGLGDAAHERAQERGPPLGVKKGAASIPDPMEWAVRNGMTPAYRREVYDLSVQRIATVLGFPEGGKDITSLALLTRYGLGTKRSLDQFIEFTGVDTRSKTVFGDRCKELSWVPFEFDADPSTVTGDIWGYGPEPRLPGGKDIPLSSGVLELHSTGQFEEVPEEVLARAAALAAVGSAVDATSASIPPRPQHKHQHRHRGKELWWIFQPLDTAVEMAIAYIDQHGPKSSSSASSMHIPSTVYGLKVVKFLLLLAPIVLLVFAAALWVATDGRAFGSSSSSTSFSTAGGGGGFCIGRNQKVLHIKGKGTVVFDQDLKKI